MHQDSRRMRKPSTINHTSPTYSSEKSHHVIALTEKRIIVLILCLLMAVLFVGLFSSTTSPFVPRGYYSTDSAIFQVIGRGWTEGMLPYTDLWDSKGPFIFFINAIGYWLTRTSLGVFLLQVVNLTAVFYVIYCWLRKVYSPRWSWPLLIVCCIGLAWNYDYGNSTGEYLLLPLVIALYGFYHWGQQLKAGRWPHPPLYAFIDGIVIGLSMMSRPTNAASICVICLLVAVALLYHQLWGNLLLNVLGLMAGIAMTVLPFLLYFWVKGTLGEMWYATFAYNFDYLSTSASEQGPSIAQTAYRYAFCLLLTVVGIYTWMKEKRHGYFSFSLVITALATFIYLNHTYGYLNYGLIAWPFLPLSLILLSRLSYPNIRGWLFGCVALAVMAVAFARVRFIFQPHDLHLEAFHHFIQKNIPEEDRKMVLLYNCNPYLYLEHDLPPACPYFAVQDWAANNSRTMRQRLCDYNWSEKVRWMVVCGSPKEVVIHQSLSNHDYVICDENRQEQITCFRRISDLYLTPMLTH